MKLGIISDLHCNLYGLQCALEAMDGVDELLCLGDAIYAFQFSNETISALKARGALMILGNHEEVFLSEAGTRVLESNGTDRDLVAWLAEQPHRRTLTFGGKRVLMTHSTPWDPRGEYIFPHSSKLARFAEADADIVLYGHTHAQVVRRFGKVLVVNPGSAGEACYAGNNWQLSCAILDTVSEEVELLGFRDPRYTDRT